MKSFFMTILWDVFERLLIARHISLAIYNAVVFVVLCDEEEMHSCVNEMLFATKMEKDDVSAILLIVHSPISLLRLNVSLF